MKTQDLTVQYEGKPCYNICYRKDFTELGAMLSELGFQNRRLCIVTDSNAGPLYADAVLQAISPVSPEIVVYTIPAGEEHKNLDTISGLYRFLAEHHFDRHDLLIALGGGVIGDMTGFASATYLRGMDFVQIPTTLLAQTDSSIGGKTGVDLDGLKNMVGAFHMPRLVYSNASVLMSLDGRQFASGFAEVMKHGLILDQDYYTWLLENLYEIEDRDLDTLTEMIAWSNRIKQSVVEKDPTEKGDRALLNFGHTIGHAIEKYRNFELLHGECVALGCVAAAYISKKKGFISTDTCYEIRDMFVPFGLPISVENVDPQAVLELMKSDKKADRGVIRFVLLKDIGHAFLDSSVTDVEILEAIQELLYFENGD